jgi:hypothetical protein
MYTNHRRHWDPRVAYTQYISVHPVLGVYQSSAPI